MNNILTVMPWRRLIKVGKPFWVSNESKTAIAYLAIILLLLAAKTYIAVFIVQTAGYFMTSIEQKSLADVYLYLTLSIIAIFFTVPIEVYYNFIKTRLSLIWRQWLSQSLIEKYFVERLGLAIESSREIDNPEQRITQDVDTFCNSSVRLSITILDASVNVCTFIVVLWNLSPVLAFTVIAYSTVGLLIVSNIGRTLIALSDRQIAIEADLRSTLKEARAELTKTKSFAGKCSLLPTVKEAQSRLLSVVATLMNIMLVHKNIQLFTGTYNHLMPLIPAVIMTPAYIAGDIQFGVITQAVLAFTAVFNGATVLIGHFGDISHFAAIVNRLGSLSERMAGGERQSQSVNKVLGESTDNSAQVSKVKVRASLSR
ncbi:MAG: hypothetical protein IT342_03810 [Candidatus Melainabacteria bacterium]|nr:hypothetical protein [Candidatus Melainabacteria bacterium]